jgi:hypothetical protein
MKLTPKCIFCEATKLSREHIFAAWMQKYFKPSQRSAHVVTYQRDDSRSGTLGSHSINTGHLHRPGDIGSQKLKCVCEPCNNGWMSKLQETAKPHLIPLITGSDFSIDGDEKKKAILSWATMSSIILEYADVRKVAVSREDCIDFKEKKVPSEKWAVWIAPFGGASHRATYHHWAFGIETNGKADTGCTTQITHYRAGNLLVLLAYSRHQFIVDSLQKFFPQDLRFTHVHGTHPSPAPLSPRPLSEEEYLSTMTILKGVVTRGLGISQKPLDIHIQHPSYIALAKSPQRNPPQSTN